MKCLPVDDSQVTLKPHSIPLTCPFCGFDDSFTGDPGLAGLRSVFWATVCITVRPMLSDRCLSCLSVCPVLSVMLVYCGQTVGWIKLKLGTEEGIGPGHIVLDVDPAPSLQKGVQRPNFLPMSVVVKRGWMD